MLASCSYALPLARTLSWCIVCATAHLPNVVLVGACGPALSELVGSSENVQFSGCGTESQGGTYWVRGYAARELRFSVLTVTVSEAGCSQSDYYGAVHGLWLILARTTGAFV